MRIRARLGRESVIALKEVKKILFGEENTRITNGFIIAKAWHKISSKKDNIDWHEVSIKNISRISNNKDDVIGVHTTLNIEEKALDSIKDFQYSLSQENKQIYYFPYIIKLILFAVILENDGELPMKQSEK